MTDSFRNRLRQSLKEAGLSQASLARQVKVSRSAVSLWLSGGIDKVSADHLLAVARACHVDPEWLASGHIARTKTKNMASQFPPPSPEDELLHHAIAKMPSDAKTHLAALIEALVAVEPPPLPRPAHDRPLLFKPKRQ